MRINQFVAQATGLSRRAADVVIKNGRVSINDQVAQLGAIVNDSDKVTLDNKQVKIPKYQTIMLNKPTSYVTSRSGQGSQTIYDLLPKQYHSLKPIGRLDKDSSGLLLLTNDGQLAQELSHPSQSKIKVYEIVLNKILKDKDRDKIEVGVDLDDGISKLKLIPIGNSSKQWQVSMTEGRNRQIRRTFDALKYRVIKLHRIKFDDYELGKLKSGQTKQLR